MPVAYETVTERRIVDGRHDGKLFPIARRAERNIERLGKFDLGHPQLLANLLGARHAPHLRKILFGERGIVRIGEPIRNDRFLGHIGFRSPVRR